MRFNDIVFNELNNHYRKATGDITGLTTLKHKHKRDQTLNRKNFA